MTPQEKKAALVAGKIIRSTRKARGWNQIDTAKKIGISQSALSKMESGSLIPSVHQWFEFCGHSGIPADSHLNGYIDRLEPIRFQEVLEKKGFKINDLYTHHAGSSARSMLPLLKWLEINLGYVKSQRFITEMGIDPDYFVNLDHPISFRFAAELIKKMKTQKLYKKSDLVPLSQLVSDPKNHGGLYSSYHQAHTSEALLRTAFSKSSFYEVNFDYQLEELNPKKLSFSAKPRLHLSEGKQTSFNEMKDFICEYRNHYFKKLLEIVMPKSAPFREVQCFFEGSDRCIHETVSG